jgi:hypothetical protein
MAVRDLVGLVVLDSACAGIQVKRHLLMAVRDLVGSVVRDTDCAGMMTMLLLHPQSFRAAPGIQVKRHSLMASRGLVGSSFVLHFRLRRDKPGLRFYPK